MSGTLLALAIDEAELATAEHGMLDSIDGREIGSEGLRLSSTDFFLSRNVVRVNTDT